MHFKDIVQNFNISTFFVHCCLLVFTLLLSLRVEGILGWSYGLVFIPLWLWKLVVLAAMLVGVGVWIKKKSLRRDSEHKKLFAAMIVSSVLQLPLFVTELMVVINLENGGLFRWTAVFTPLYFLALLSIAPVLWSCCLKRTFDIGLLSVGGLLQFLFLGIRLDRFVSWTWAVVFIPTWILVCVFVLVLVVYTCVCSCLLKSPEHQPEARQRKPVFVIFTVCAFSLTLCVVLFLALLVSQLDGRLSAPYPAIFVPLYVAIIILIVSTVARKPGNIWWFGIRKNFVEFVLDHCPLLQEYFNISYQPQSNEAELSSTLPAPHKNPPKQKAKTKKEIHDVNELYPYIDVYTPD